MTLQGKMTPGEDSSGSSSSADPNLLETIDQLFELNVGDYVALPQVTPLFTLSLWQRCSPHCQLLVVGDQSRYNLMIWFN